jgi:hypothetical protein
MLCIVDGNSFVNVRAITPKNQLESCENATRRQAETIEFILLIDVSRGPCSCWAFRKMDARIENKWNNESFFLYTIIVACSFIQHPFLFISLNNFIALSLKKKTFSRYSPQAGWLDLLLEMPGIIWYFFFSVCLFLCLA